MNRIILAALAALALSACAAPAAPAETTTTDLSAQAALVQDGRVIAETQCARCHQVGEVYADVRPAPPFRTLLSRYRADVLEEELIAGVRVAHPMPEFQFNPQGVDALIAYLQTIQVPPDEAPRAAAAGPANVESGRQLAEMYCASCHTLAATGESHHPAAPPFRDLSLRYPVNALEEAFAEGVLVEHPDMPEFSLEPAQIDDLLAYLTSIQTRRGG